MKLGLSLLISLFSVSSQASSVQIPEKYFLSCGTSASQITVFLEKDRIVFHLEDLMGFQNFPLNSMPVKPDMAPLALRGIEELKDFDGDVIISWEKNKCLVDSTRPNLIRCSGFGSVDKPQVTFINSKGETHPYFTANSMAVIEVREETIGLTSDLLNNMKFSLALSTPLETIPAKDPSKKPKTHTRYDLAFSNYLMTNCLTR